jgi:hypothetical protein
VLRNCNAACAVADDFNLNDALARPAPVGVNSRYISGRPVGLLSTNSTQYGGDNGSVTLASTTRTVVPLGALTLQLAGDAPTTSLVSKLSEKSSPAGGVGVTETRA